MRSSPLGGSENATSTATAVSYTETELRTVIADIGTAAGVLPEDAGILANCLVDAELQGAATHGVSRLAIYVRRIQRGLIDPKAPLTKKSVNAAGVLALDANNGLGQVQAVKSLNLLAPIARAQGVAVATVCNSQHFGALSYYTNLMAADGFVLLAMTNCEPAMAPAGGSEAYFGTNPIAASFPTGKGFPIKIDLATSIVARGNIIAAEKQGKTIPADWALDPNGEPTTDPHAALAGTVRTMAGHKGYALAMLVEMFSGVLSGAKVGSDVGSMYKEMDRPQGVGHFFCLLDIRAFMPVEEFRGRADKMVDALKRNRVISGVEQILVPGERSARTAKVQREKGIELAPATVRELADLCTEYKVPMLGSNSGKRKL